MKLPPTPTPIPQTGAAYAADAIDRHLGTAEGLSLLNRIGQRLGWTPGLNAIGKHLIDLENARDQAAGNRR